MRKLILVKHSLPEIVPDLPASQWRLSEEGRRRCVPLSDALAAYGPSIVVSSVEAKAIETASIVAERLGRTIETADGLQEHDRSDVGHFPCRAAFEEAVSRLFANPGELVLGRETAVQAQVRFAKAVEAVLENCRVGNAVIVAHGTVISLFVASCAGVRPFEYWKRLGLPSFAVLSLPDLSLLSTVYGTGRAGSL